MYFLHKFGQIRTKLKSLQNKIEDISGFHDTFRDQLYFLKIINSYKNFPELYPTLPEKNLTFQGRVHDLNATSVVSNCPILSVR